MFDRIHNARLINAVLPPIVVLAAGLLGQFLGSFLLAILLVTVVSVVILVTAWIFRPHRPTRVQIASLSLLAALAWGTMAPDWMMILSQLLAALGLHPPRPHPLPGFWQRFSVLGVFGIFTVVLNFLWGTQSPLRAVPRETKTTDLAPQQMESTPAHGPSEAASSKAAEPSTKLTLIAPPKLDSHAIQDMVGRRDEMDSISRAWDNETISIISIVAWGGVGKTSLVANWMMTKFLRRNWEGVEGYFDWSFYSEKTRHRGYASSNAFVDAALRHFGVPETADSTASAFTKGMRLAKLVVERRTLLILDGLEPLQHPRGSGNRAGMLKDPAIEALLKSLARKPTGGLLVLTTRTSVADLNPYLNKTVREKKLKHLSDADGAKLLYAAGVQRKGNERIRPDDPQLLKASHDVGGHALTLRLLGRYLWLARGGDVEQRPRVSLEIADKEVFEGHAFRVIQAYERWLRGSRGVMGWLRRLFSAETRRRYRIGGRQIALLRLMALFNRPADSDCLEVLRKLPPINGLTDALVDLNDDDWNITLTELDELDLIHRSDRSAMGLESTVDIHPLVREYFTRQLLSKWRSAWKIAHRRLYQHLTRSPMTEPRRLREMMPLYHAVHHGCMAGLHQQVLEEVLRRRIWRGPAEFSMIALGCHATDLDAVSHFYQADAAGGVAAEDSQKRWTNTVPGLNDLGKADILFHTGALLCATGDLTASIGPLTASLPMFCQQHNWDAAATTAMLLGGYNGMLGKLSLAVRYAEESVEHAGRCGNQIKKLCVAAIGIILNWVDARAAAEEAFADVRSIQEDIRSSLYYSYYCFYYGEFLLDQGRFDDAEDLATEELALLPAEWLLPNATCHLTLGKAIGLNPHAARTSEAESHLDKAVELMRQSGMQQHMPDVLLARAALRRVQYGLTEDPSYSEMAECDLEEAEEITRRSAMIMFRIEAAFERAQLALSLGDREAARRNLREAKTHIERTEDRFDSQQRELLPSVARGYIGVFKNGQVVGYHRRTPEIAAMENKITGD